MLPKSIALWDLPFVDVVAAAVQKRIPESAIRRASPETCARLLSDGEVDMALLPTISALVNSERFDVLPAFALSSWGYPFAQIRLASGLTEISSELVVPIESAQEAFVASVVLQEHYGTRILVVPTDVQAGPDVNHLALDPRPTAAAGAALDLGQEWFELTNYPMVWGVFGMIRGRADETVIAASSDTAALAEAMRQALADDQPEPMKSFLVDDLRFRMDDLAVASLTELSEYLFYYSGSDEPPELNVVSLPDTPGDHDVPSNGLPTV